jgi:hypothetical protein
MAISISACSEDDGRVPVYPVTGKVTVEREVPVGALVVLYPVQPNGKNELRPSGTVRSDGAFSLTTYVSDDGAPAGEYIATLQWSKLIKKGQDYSAGPNVVPKEYATRETSPWNLRVETKQNDLAPRDIAK